MNKLNQAMRFHLPNWVGIHDVTIIWIEVRVIPCTAYAFGFAGRQSKNANLSGLFYKKQEMKYQFGTLKWPDYDILELQDVRGTNLEMVPGRLLKALRQVAETGVQQTLEGHIWW